MRTSSSLAALAALAMASLLTLGADGEGGTALSGLSTAVDGATLEVSGTVTWAGEERVVIGTDGAGDGALHPDIGGAAGLDLVGATVSQPDGDVDELEFVWLLDDLPSDPPPPEFVRYLWQMTVDGKEYWIQAKSSDVTTAPATVDDPVGTVTHVPNNFRLRSNCDAAGTVSYCAHVAWLDGAFDADADEVRVTVPLDTEAGPDFTRGAEVNSAAVQASFQAAISNNATSDSLAFTLPYTVPTKTVAFSATDADGATTDLGTVTLTGSGEFSESLEVGDLPAGTYTLTAEACFNGSQNDDTGFEILPLTDCDAATVAFTR